MSTHLYCRSRNDPLRDAQSNAPRLNVTQSRPGQVILVSLGSKSKSVQAHRSVIWWYLNFDTFASICQTTTTPGRYQHVPPSSPHFSCKVTVRPARTKTSATNWEKSRPLTAKASHTWTFAQPCVPSSNPDSPQCIQSSFNACLRWRLRLKQSRQDLTVLVVGPQTNPCFAREAASVHISNETVCHLETDAKS